MADPFEAENDAEWSQWFAALHDGHKAKAIKAVTGESNEFSLRDGATGQNSNITHLPHRFFNESRGLTELNLRSCSSLAALPESLGHLQALTGARPALLHLPRGAARVTRPAAGADDALPGLLLLPRGAA